MIISQNNVISDGGSGLKHSLKLQRYYWPKEAYHAIEPAKTGSHSTAISVLQSGLSSGHSRVFVAQQLIMFV